METETRSIPDLSLLRLTFLFATMKGESLLAKVAEMDNKHIITEIAAIIFEFIVPEFFFFVKFSDRRKILSNEEKN